MASYPGNNDSFVKSCHFINMFSFNKALDVLHSNFALSVFIFTFIIFKSLCVLTHTHTIHCGSTYTLDPVDKNSDIATYDFENPIYQDKNEGEEDCEVLGELTRLLQQEERAIQPHEEPVEMVNLGTEEDNKEVKIGANMEHSGKERLIQMLHEYVEIFA